MQKSHIHTEPWWMPQTSQESEACIFFGTEHANAEHCNQVSSKHGHFTCEKLFTVLPRLFPISGSFLGPKISAATPAITTSSGTPRPKSPRTTKFPLSCVWNCLGVAASICLPSLNIRLDCEACAPVTTTHKTKSKFLICCLCLWSIFCKIETWNHNPFTSTDTGLPQFSGMFNQQTEFAMINVQKTEIA